MRTWRRSRSPRRRVGAAAASLVRDMGGSPALSPLQQRHHGVSLMRLKRGYLQPQGTPRRAGATVRRREPLPATVTVRRPLGWLVAEAALLEL